MSVGSFLCGRVSSPDCGSGLAAILLEPKTVQKPKTLIANGDTRVDQFYWLRDDSRADPEVLTHLKVPSSIKCCSYLESWLRCSLGRCVLMFLALCVSFPCNRKDSLNRKIPMKNSSMLRYVVVNMPDTLKQQLST